MPGIIWVPVSESNRQFSKQNWQNKQISVSISINMDEDWISSSWLVEPGVKVRSAAEFTKKNDWLNGTAKHY